MLNLDTHIFIYALLDKLTAKEKELLQKNQWSISAIVIWEMTKLVQRGRVTVDMDDPEFTVALDSVHVWPIDLNVCRAIRSLDFSGDPADEIIAATSLVHNVPLLTRDRQIRSSTKIPLV